MSAFKLPKLEFVALTYITTTLGGLEVSFLFTFEPRSKVAEEHPSTDFVLTTPVILGHESSGTVVEIGSAVKNLKTGDLVAELERTLP
jgi:hypothetical protein